MKNDPRSYDRNFCNCVKKPEKNSGLQRGLNPWPRDTGATLYQLSYEATDVGSRSIVGSYVPVKEMNVNDVYEINHMWTADMKSNEEWFISYASFTYIIIFHGNIWTQNWPAPNVSGFIAQLVRASHRYREVTGSSPVEVLHFFFRLLYAIAKIAIITARIILHLISYPQFTYDLFHTHHSPKIILSFNLSRASLDQDSLLLGHATNWGSCIQKSGFINGVDNEWCIWNKSYVNCGYEIKWRMILAVVIAIFTIA